MKNIKGFLALQALHRLDEKTGVLPLRSLKSVQDIWTTEQLLSGIYCRNFISCPKAIQYFPLSLGTMQTILAPLQLQ